MKLPLLPLAALLILSLVWGYSWVALKIGLLDAGPISFASVRTLLGGLSLLLFLALTRRPFLPRRLPEIALLGIVQTSAFVGLSTWSLVEGSAGTTAFLVFTMPFWNLLLSWYFLGETVRGTQWLAVSFAVIGLTILIAPWDLAGPFGNKLIAAAAGLVWASANILVKRYEQRGSLDLMCVTAWQLIIGSIPLFLFLPIVSEPPIMWSSRFMVVLVFTAIISTACGWILWLYLLKHLPTGMAGMSTLMVPVVAVLSAAWQISERPNELEIWGMSLIVVSLIILSVRAIRTHRELAGPVAQE